MNFFLDENFPKSAEQILQELGHKTFLLEKHQVGIDDMSIFRLAQEKQAIFLTTDKDFFHTIPFQFKIHYGIIIIALKLPNRKNILEKLEWAINNFDLNNFKDKVILLRDSSYNKR